MFLLGARQRLLPVPELALRAAGATDAGVALEDQRDRLPVLRGGIRRATTRGASRATRRENAHAKCADGSPKSPPPRHLFEHCAVLPC